MMMRALLHLLRSNAHSPNVKQSCHLGQNTKPVKNAATAASFAHRGSRNDRKGRRRTQEEEDGGLCWQVHLQETAENGRVGDRNITYIVIDSDYEKSSEEDEVSINSFYSKRSDIHSEEQCPCDISG